MYKTFGSETLLSEDLNAIMRQTIIRVADANELDLLAPVEAGMLAYREDDTFIYQHDGESWLPLLQDTGWLPIDLVNGWQHVSSAPGHYRVKNGFLLLKGRVTGGSGVIANLPVAPEDAWFWMARDGGSPNSVAMGCNSSGAITPATTPSAPNLQTVIPLG